MGYNYFLTNNTLTMKDEVKNNVLQKYHINNAYDSYAIQNALSQEYPEFDFTFDIGINGVENISLSTINHNAAKKHYAKHNAGSDDDKWRVLCNIIQNTDIVQGRAVLEGENGNILQVIH